MKKYQIFGTLTVLAASMMLTSCFKNEEDDIFDKNAAERLEEAKTYYSDILTDKGGKWQLEYYANGDEHGYVYLMSFNKNGTVTISGQNEYIGYELNPAGTGAKTYGTATSLWEVVGDNGPVLSFNSYNRIFHIFSSPYDIPPYGDNETDESGKGHEGDYEFDLMKYSNDTLYVEGKKREISMIMTRIDANTDDRVYMEYVTAMADSFFHPKVPIVFMNMPNGKRYAIMDGASQMPTIWDFDLDRISYEQSYTGIVNHDGFALMDPLVLGEYTVQRFVRNDDGSLRCIENPSVIVDAGHLNEDVMFNRANIVKTELSSDYIMGWTLNSASLSGQFQSAYDAVKTAINKGTRRLGAITVEYADSTYYNDKLALLKGNNRVPFDSYVMVIRIQVNSSSTVNVILPLTPKFDGEDDVTMELGEPTLPTAVTMVNNTPELAAFIQLFDNQKMHLSAENLLAPTVLTMSRADGDTGSVDFVVR